MCYITQTPTEFENLLREHAILRWMYKAWNKDKETREQFLERCVCTLARNEKETRREFIELQAIAPRRYETPDGSEKVYRVPTELIPLIKLKGV